MTGIRIFDVRYLTNRDGSVNTGTIEDIRACEESGKTAVVRHRTHTELKHALGTDVLNKFDNGVDMPFDFPLDW